MIPRSHEKWRIKSYAQLQITYFYDLNLALQDYYIQKAFFPRLCSYPRLQHFHTVTVPFVPAQHFVWFVSEVSKDCCSSEQASCSLSWQHLRVQMSGLSFADSTCSFGSSNTGLNFGFSSEAKKLLHSCNKQVGEGRKRDREKTL